MKKQCRRKVWPLLNPVTHAIQGAAITDTASLNKLRMASVAITEAQTAQMWAVKAATWRG